MTQDAPPSDTGKRMADCGAACVAAWQAWQGKRRDTQARETLANAVHDLRRALARLEIDMAVSERENMTQRPLPIPAHRSARRDEGANKAGQSPELPSLEQEENGDGSQPPPRRTMRRRLMTE